MAAEVAETGLGLRDRDGDVADLRGGGGACGGQFRGRDERGGELLRAKIHDRALHETGTGDGELKADADNHFRRRDAREDGDGIAESDGSVSGCGGVRDAGGGNGDGVGIWNDGGGQVIAVAHDGAHCVVAARDAVHGPSHAGS